MSTFAFTTSLDAKFIQLVDDTNAPEATPHKPQNY